MVKKLVIIISLILGLATITGTMFKLDARWAKAGEVQKLEQRLDQKIEMDRAHQLNMWMVEIVIQNGEDKSHWSAFTYKSYSTMEAEYNRIMAKYNGSN